ncbi:MAG: hypothetical protein NVSMB56_08680 [Pyrinomonadaceae bacterium]
MNEKYELLANTLRHWLPLAFIITALTALVYLAVQQSQRSAANDPQIQIAEDAAAALANNRQPKDFEAVEKIEISRSLAPFIIVYDAQGQPIASSGVLDGRMPTLPSGVFEFARNNQQNRISWQPRPGVRSALVIVHFRGQTEGFVAAGRSLREIEQREAYTLKAAAWCWLISLIATFSVIAFFCWLRGRNLH